MIAVDAYYERMRRDPGHLAGELDRMGIHEESLVSIQKPFVHSTLRMMHISLETRSPEQLNTLRWAKMEVEELEQAYEFEQDRLYWDLQTKELRQAQRMLRNAR